MGSQFAQLDGRRFVNENFISELRRLYPTTTWKMPLGFRTYTGWTGKDEVLFTEYRNVEGLDGKVYEVTVDPVNPAAFDDQILAKIKHTTKTASLVQEPKTARTKAGLYGYERSIQAACELAATRLHRSAMRLVKATIKQDESVFPFLQLHAKRADSSAARMLLSAFRGPVPKIQLEMPRGKEAAATRYGLYGYPIKTANLGLMACSSIQETAGLLAAELHRRQRDFHANITGFLGEHAKTARCKASRLLLSSYPESGFEFRRSASTPPQTVEEWVALSLDAIE